MKLRLEGLNLGSKPAPGELALVQGFVNTVDLETMVDDVTTPEALSSWLVERGLLRGARAVSASEHAVAMDVRETLRSLLLFNNGVPLDDKSLATLRKAGAKSPLAFAVDAAAAGSLVPVAQGLQGALGRLFAIVYTSMADGSWSRLKACPNDKCHWAFFDHSKNRSGTWCTMAVCGSRMKARSYRWRHHLKQSRGDAA